MRPQSIPSRPAQRPLSGPSAFQIPKTEIHTRHDELLVWRNFPAQWPRTQPGADWPHEEPLQNECEIFNPTSTGLATQPSLATRI